MRRDRETELRILGILLTAVAMLAAVYATIQWLFRIGVIHHA